MSFCRFRTICGLVLNEVLGTRFDTYIGDVRATVVTP